MSGKRKTVLIFAGGLFILLGTIFLPGPNGLVRVLLRLYRIKQHQRALVRLKAKTDTLERKIKLWQNPDYAAKMARTLLGPDTSSQSDTNK